MNWAEVQHDWAKMKIVVQSRWQRLTEQDLVVIDGRREELAQILQRRCGLAAQAAEDAICAFEKDVRRPGAVK